MDRTPDAPPGVSGLNWLQLDASGMAFPLRRPTACLEAGPRSAVDRARQTAMRRREQAQLLPPSTPLSSRTSLFCIINFP